MVGNGNTTRLELTQVRKRDGTIVPFDQSKISRAVYRAMEVSKDKVDLENDPLRIAEGVVGDLRKIAQASPQKDYVPGIEEIQDLVQRNLIRTGFEDTTVGYIRYRDDRTRIRSKRQEVPERVKNLVLDSKKYFRNNAMGEFVYYRTYSRWIEEEGRRETWPETVNRYADFMKETLESRLSEDEYSEAKDFILDHKSMPSMRLLWGAGPAVRDSNVVAYNCAFTTPVKHTRDFGEILYVLMCGTGEAFSVEDQFVQQLPIVRKKRGEKMPTHVVGDSKVGWAEALNKGIGAWYDGYDLDFDYSKVRPAGARLMTMGGRSSGPNALIALMDYTKGKILSRQGSRL